MKITITFDDANIRFMDDIHDAIDLSMKDALRGVANSVRGEILTLAAEGLTTSRAEYKAAVGRVKMNRKGTIATIELDGQFAKWIEDGGSGRNMHEAMLSGSSPSIRISGAGDKYRYVPFTHSKPGAKGSTGTPMGLQFKNTNGIDTAALGKKVWSYAKELGNAPNQASRMPAGIFDKLKESHSVDPFAGMRKEGTGGKTNYKTYRTISDAVPNKWYHPGIKAHKFFDQASENVDKAFTTAMTTIVVNAMKGKK